MKIEMQDLPKVRDALDKLILDQHNLLGLTTNGQPEDMLRVVGEGGYHEGHVTREELAEIFEKRIDENLKFLRQRYQIDFAPAPSLSVAPMGHLAAAPPVRNPAPAASEEDLSAE